MVRYGFDDIEEHKDSSNALEPSFRHGHIESPERSTTDLHTSWIQIPGSFTFGSSSITPQPLVKTPQKDPSVQCMQELAQSSEAEDYTMSDIRSSAGDSDYASRDSFTSHHDLEQRSNTDGSSMLVRETYVQQATWIRQMQAQQRRFRLLEQTSMPTFRKRHSRNGRTQANAIYNAQDLDRDLFCQDDRLARKVASSSSRIMHDFPQTTCPVPQTFAFSWASSLLLSGAGNKVTKHIIGRHAKSRSEPYDKHCLAQILAQTTFVLDSANVPQALLKSRLAARMILNDSMTQEERSIWHLAGALFDQIDGLQDPSSINEDRMRRSFISSWLQVAVLSTIRIEEKKAQSVAQRMYTRLTGFQIAESCAMALSNGDYHLATLLPLLGGDSNVKADLRNQLQYWQSERDHEHMDEYYLRIYELIAADFLEQPFSKTSAVIIDELDWKRVLGLYCWYGTPGTASLADVIQAFLAQVRLKEEKMLGTAERTAMLNDVHFLLLKHFAAADVASRESSGLDLSSSNVDCLTAWSLHVYLYESQGTSPISKSTSTEDYKVAFDQLTMNLFSELEAQGQWEWAIFVALYMHNELAREELIKRTLSKSSASISVKMEQFLLGTLKLPKLWLAEAKALYYRNHGAHEDECMCLLEAGLGNEAHSVLIQKIAPQAIISGQLEVARKLLVKLSKLQNIDNWDRGGQPYKDAIDLILLCRDHQHNKSLKETLQSTKPQVSRLSDALEHMYERTFEQRVAKHEITNLLIECLPQNQLAGINSKRAKQLNTAASIRAYAIRHYEVVN